jgi:hypothetical protein
VVELQRSAGNRALARLIATRRVIQRFVPTDLEKPGVTTALDSLLGADKDPSGIRAVLTTAASGLDALKAAATAVVTAAPDAALRTTLLEDVKDVAVLSDLLTACKGAVGTAAKRLARVLELDPTAARTVLALTATIEQVKALDEKIVSGSPGAIPSNRRTALQDRRLIGGHSAAILTDKTFAVTGKKIAAANATRVIDFHKLLRSDGGAAALAVVNAGSGNVVSTSVALADVASKTGKLVPPPKQPGKLAPLNVHQSYDAMVEKHKDANKDLDDLLAKVTAMAKDVRTSADVASASPDNATAVKAFVDGVDDLFAATKACVMAAKMLDAKEVAKAIQGDLAVFNTAIDSFELKGPVISGKKVSTIAPEAWTDDDVLKAGHETALVTPTLVDTPNRPADNAKIRTKHQKVVNGVAWVAIKADVTFKDGNPPSFVGGQMTSSFPTQKDAIPAPPAPNTKDDDDFYVLA